jgi:glycosyltransferase involved in cell wall biosynthesis
MTEKPRIFYLSRTAPGPVSGATLAMQRHFIDHDDVDILVATSEAFRHSTIPTLQLESNPWWQRLKQTRFCRALHNIEILAQANNLPGSLIDAASAFKPDAIFTVADLTLSEWARLLARRLDLPLIVNFQDWWPRGQFYYDHEVPFPWLLPLLERRFNRLYQEAALAFCTSEGMREFLGSHPNSHVLYPIGDPSCEEPTSTPINEAQPCRHTSRPDRKRQLVYTGTAFGSYGQMLLKLAELLRNHPSWELVIYGKQPDWPEPLLTQAQRSGLYRGFLPFQQLRSVLAAADACLSVMSFDPALEVMMRTSFTTKVLDYCSAARPLIMWGPPFCSPIRLIEKHQSGFTVITRDPAAVVQCLERLDREPELADELASQSGWLAANALSHDCIHGVFTSQINKLVFARRSNFTSA